MKLVRLLLTILIFSAVAYSQPWSGILAPSRAVDWSQAGTTIPPRTVACSSLTPTATAADINNAIANCGSGQVVFLGAGVYNLSAGIDFGAKDNVTLRGAGANSTFLVFTGSTSCNGLPTHVAMCGSNSYPGGPQNSADWTAIYSAGTTSITLSNSMNIVAGKTMIILDQLQESSDTGNIWNCVTVGVCSNNDDSSSSRGRNRPQQQEVLVTACSPSCNISGTTTVTISPGIYMPNWSSTKSPGAFWASDDRTLDGIENLSMNDGGDTLNNPSGIIMNSCYKCWVKGVKSTFSGRNHVWIYQSSHCVVRDSYFYQNQNHLAISYGVELFAGSSDNLIENNIFDSTTDSNPNNGGGGGGNVAGYNYTVQTIYGSIGWMQPSDYEHAGGNAYFLRESNQGTGFIADDVHGTHHFTTVFRNYYTGWQPNCFGIPCGNQTIPVQLYAGSRYFNVIGNVLGRTGYHNNYQDVAPNGTTGVTSIFVLGWTGNGGNAAVNPSIPGFCIDFGCASFVNYDSLTSGTLMRWGNYDVVNNAVRFVSSEVPSGLSLYANAVPATQTLPASLYLPGKPSWWNASVPFPANGPDVTGGNISGVGGFANNIPAQVCFSNSTGSNPINFDPIACYGYTDPPTLGNSGTLTTSNATSSSLTLTWAPASDTVTAQSALQYEVVSSTANNIFTVANAEANGTIVQPYTTNLTSLNLTGLASGTTYFFNVIVKDQGGNKALYVMASGTTSGLLVSPTTLQAGAAGFSYSQAIAMSGAVAPNAFSILSGALPAGLTLNTSTGLISGTPSSGGVANFTVQVTDSQGHQGQRPYSLGIAGNNTSNIVLVSNSVSYNSAPMPGFVGTFTISLNIRNFGPPLGDPIFFKITQLSKLAPDLNPSQPNKLLTADDGGGVTGDVQSVSLTGLATLASANVTFQVGLGSRQQFQLVADLYGIAQDSNLTSEEAAIHVNKSVNPTGARFLKRFIFQSPESFSPFMSAESVSGGMTPASNVRVVTGPGSRSRGVLAIDPTLPRRMAVAANDSGGNVIVSTTEDAGSTWTPTTMGRSLGGIDFFNAQDPSLAFDSLGRLSVVYVLSNMNDAANATVITESTDGVNFSPPSAISFHSAQENVIDSRPMIAIGSGGRYVAWENFGSRINVVRSEPGGIFGPPVVVASGAPVSSPTIAIGSRAVYVGWDEWGFNSQPPYNTGGRLMMASSPHGAQLTFTDPVEIATTDIGFSSPRIPMLPAPLGVVTNLNLATDPRNESRLYAAFVDNQNGLGIRVARSLDEGRTWTFTAFKNCAGGGDQFSPGLNVDSNGNVYISFYDTVTRDGGTAHLFLARSSTENSFESQEASRSSLGKPAASQFEFNYRIPDACRVRTFNTGWFNYQQISTVPVDESAKNLGSGIATNLGDHTAVAVSSQNILIAWTDTSQRKEDIYVSIYSVPLEISLRHRDKLCNGFSKLRSAKGDCVYAFQEFAEQ